MLISEAKRFVGKVVDVVHRNRGGHETSCVAEVFDVTFVPLFGPCLVSDIGDIRLDCIVSCQARSEARTA